MHSQPPPTYLSSLPTFHFHSPLGPHLLFLLSLSLKTQTHTYTHRFERIQFLLSLSLKMSLGKRGRVAMKRTTSMTGINVDLADEEPSDSVMNVAVETASPNWRDQKRSSGDNSMVIETAPFLRTCGLCNRRLRPSRDIFMYRYYYWLLPHSLYPSFMGLTCDFKHYNSTFG